MFNANIKIYTVWKTNFAKNLFENHQFMNKMLDMTEIWHVTL